MLDLIIVVGFLIYSVGVGLRQRRLASRGPDQYFLAGRSLKGWQAGLSMAATQFAADTPLLVTGLIATGGVFLLWRLWIYGIAFLLMGFLFAACWRRAGVLTDAELAELRYDGHGVLALRALKALYYGTLVNCVVLAMVLVAAVRIADVFLPWHTWLPAPWFSAVSDWVDALGIDLSGASDPGQALTQTTSALISLIAVLVFTALYSTTGGLRSVVKTDVMQLVLALVGSALYAAYVVDHVGGLGGLGERLAQAYGAGLAERLLSFAPPAGSEAGLAFLAIISMQWLFQMNSDGTGYLAQRAMACESEDEARRACIIFAWTQIVLRSLLWLVIGVGLLLVFPLTGQSADSGVSIAAREMTFVTGVDSLLPPGVRGLMLVGLLAALASTVDTHLNWGASYWAHDLYGRLVCRHWLGRDASPREIVLVARLATVLIIVIALAVMANLGSIQEAWSLSLLFGAGMGGVLVLRWVWERTNLHAELAAIVASILLAPVLLHTVEAEWLRLGAMAIGSTGAAVAASLIAAPVSREARLRFYRRVRPPGFWRRTALEAGEDPRAPLTQLRDALTDTAGMSAAMFLTLTGSAGLLLHPPETSMAYAGLLLAAALLTLWWHRRRRLQCP